MNNTANLTAKERNALIRYAITIGTSASCATRSLLRPFKNKYLKQAMKEVLDNIKAENLGYEEKIKNYSEGAEVDKSVAEFLCNDLSKESIAAYYNALIKQNKDIIKRFPRTYSVSVDYEFTDKKSLAFHNSLNPRPSFGYSNALHEVCEFELTDDIKQAFLSSSLAQLPDYKDDWTHDWGNVFFDSIINLSYEDLQVKIGDRTVLSTISHENIFDVDFTDDELKKFIPFDNKVSANTKTVEKLKSGN